MSFPGWNGLPCAIFPLFLGHGGLSWLNADGQVSKLGEQGCRRRMYILTRSQATLKQVGQGSYAEEVSMGSIQTLHTGAQLQGEAGCPYRPF